MLQFGLVLVLSMFVGFISLCQELLWFRILTFTTGGTPSAFGYVLGFFLIGVALGSLQAQKVLKRKKMDPYVYISLMLGVAAIAYYLSIPLIGHFYTLAGAQATILALLLVALISYFMGGVFPVLCHVGTQKDAAVGVSVSWIYLANILGATTGPLLTGFVLMDLYTTEQLILMMCLVTMLLAGLLYILNPNASKKSIVVLVTAVSLLGMVMFQQPLYHDTIARLQFQKKFKKGKKFRYVLQNHSGIITVVPGWRGKDAIYGHGKYDGRFNVDPRTNLNGIQRCYHMANLHPNPARVLMVGMGSGSWARAVANFRKVKHMTIVEINPGYPAIIKKYPEIASVLRDKRVTYVADDGRRWLVRHPKARFDFIIMNTTHHWRSNIANLLSVEFYQLAKRHLNPGGVIYFNATGLNDNDNTLSTVFKHVTRYVSCIGGSDKPFRLTRKQREANLMQFYFQNGKQIFPKGSRLLRKMASERVSDWAPHYRRRRHLHMTITDDNMSNEYKHNTLRGWRLDKRKSWTALWKKLRK